jgi:fermentation-respiration switch protein FrsA (DUF1100 family)
MTGHPAHELPQVGRWCAWLPLFLLPVLMLVQGCSRLLFFPSPTLRVTPSEIGLEYRDIEFASSDGTPLHGWLLRAMDGTGDAVAPTVLFLHGNAGNVSTHLGSALWLPAQGFQVFLFDYRGFGRSKGEPDLVSAHQDAVSALRVTAALPEVDHERIVVIGQSLGGAIALDVVAAMEAEIPVRGLVVDSAPSDFRGIAREKLARFWLTWPLQVPLSWTIPSLPSPRAAAAAIGESRTVPLMIVSGDLDEIVPARHAFELSGAAGSAELVVVPGAGHIGAFERAWVRQYVVAFLRRALPPPTRDVARCSLLGATAPRIRARCNQSTDGSPPASCRSGFDIGERPGARFDRRASR